MAKQNKKLLINGCFFMYAELIKMTKLKNEMKIFYQKWNYDLNETHT